MSKWSKLYAELVANRRRPLRFADLEGLLRAFGFTLARTRGSHYKHDDIPFVFTINPEGKSAHQYQKHRFLELVEEYGLHIEE